MNGVEILGFYYNYGCFFVYGNFNEIGFWVFVDMDEFFIDLWVKENFDIIRFKIKFNVLYL